MTRAFGGDSALKADLLARIDRHAQAGTLHFGPTRWDGTGGSPLGVSIESEDIGAYAARFGYPLALAGLLDPMTAGVAPEQAIADARAWVASVVPGTDLARVPARIAQDLLVRMGADRFAPERNAELCKLYEAEAADGSPERRRWSDLRDRIERELSEAEPASDAAAALGALAAACWPLHGSRSVLVTLMNHWLHDTLRAPDLEFDAAEADRAHAMLETIYAETAPQREAGEAVDIPALFRLRAPDLAARYEAHLMRNNARFQTRQQLVPGIVLRHLAAAV